MPQNKKVRQLNATRRTVLTKEKGRDSELVKHNNTHLINLGPQTNKEVESRKFDFGFTNKSVLKEDGGKGKKGKRCSIAKTQEKKMHHHNRNQTFHEVNSNTINYEPIANFHPTSATNHYVVATQGGSATGVSNSGKSTRDGAPSINTNSNRHCKLSHFN